MVHERWMACPTLSGQSLWAARTRFIKKTVFSLLFEVVTVNPAFVTEVLAYGLFDFTSLGGAC